jgi:phosphoribosylformylglycinamidine synthase
MTESVLDDFARCRRSPVPPLRPQPLATVDVLAGDAPRWSPANGELGLALSPDEIDYLVEASRAPAAIPPTSS